MHRISISIYSLFYFCLLLVLVRKGFGQVDVLSDLSNLNFDTYNIGRNELARPGKKPSLFSVDELLKRRLKFLQKIVNCINDQNPTKFCVIVRKIHELKEKIHKKVSNRMSSQFFILTSKEKARRMQGLLHRFWTKYCLKESFAIKTVFENCVMIAKIYQMEQQIGFLKFFAENESKILKNIDAKDPAFPEVIKRTYKAMKSAVKKQTKKLTQVNV